MLGIIVLLAEDSVTIRIRVTCTSEHPLDLVGGISLSTSLRTVQSIAMFSMRNYP